MCEERKVLTPEVTSAIAEATNQPAKDVRAVLKAFNDLLADQLAVGNTVSYSGLGSFTAERNWRGLRVAYCPAVGIKRKIKQIEAQNRNTYVNVNVCEGEN